MKQIIAFDIGGTACKWSIFDYQGLEQTSGEFRTAAKNKDFVLQEMATIIKKYANDETKIGIASPTAINITTGYAFGISGIENYGNFNLYKELGELIEYKWPIKATNDANAALMGTLFFEDKKPSNAILITIGTGIGGAVYINDQLISGRNGFAGEFGYGYMYGNNLNISQNISTSSLVNEVNKVMSEDYNGKDIWKIYELKADETIFQIVESWLNRLSKFCCFLTYAFNCEKIYLGGGISNQDQICTKLTKKMLSEFNGYGVKEILPEVCKAKDGGKAGLYGAMTLWI